MFYQVQEERMTVMEICDNKQCLVHIQRHEMEKSQVKMHIFANNEHKPQDFILFSC